MAINPSIPLQVQPGPNMPGVFQAAQNFQQGEKRNQLLDLALQDAQKTPGFAEVTEQELGVVDAVLNRIRPSVSSMTPEQIASEVQQGAQALQQETGRQSPIFAEMMKDLQTGGVEAFMGGLKEYDEIRNPQKPVPVAEGTALVNPSTQQEVYRNPREPKPQTRMLTAEEVSQLGLDPSVPYQQKGDGTITPVNRGPLTTVNVGEGPQVGTIPPGFQLTKDQSGAYRMEPIPGGPAEAAEEAAIDKQTGRTAQTRRAGTTVVQDLGRGLQLMPEIAQDDGVVGANVRIAKSKIPGTPEYQVLLFKESALSNVGLDTLQQMRENSPTGGALGQVPIQQQKRLEQVLGSLEIGQTPEVMESNMQRIMNVYTDIMYGSPEERARAVEQGKLTQEESDAVDKRYFDLPFDEMGRPVQRNAPANVPPPPPGFEVD